MQTTQTIMTVENIRISDIAVGPRFRRLKRGKVEDLKKSINRKGLLEPIGVRRLDGPRRELEYGEHRLQACKELGWETIPCIVRNDDELAGRMNQVVENIHRNEEKNYTVFGDYFTELINEHAWTLLQVAEEASKTTAFIEWCMRLAKNIDPQLHGDFTDVIPRTLTQEFSRVQLQDQAGLFEKIKKKRAAAPFLRTEEIRWIIRAQVAVAQTTTSRQQVQVCQRCGGLIDKATIGAGKTVSSVGKEGIQYSHNDPADCHFTTTFIIVHTGEIPKAKVQEQVGYFREKLEEIGATITVYGRHGSAKRRSSQ